MRVGSSTRYYLLTDHLGSTTIIANSSGALSSEKRYMPWGEERYTNGSTPTTYRYTGQREEYDLGLYFYQSRWYDPQLSRFLQADSVVPDPYNSQAWDRYAYANNNPLYFTDPDGHCPAPSSNSGRVICVDLFIQTETIGGGFGQGDNRDFDADSDQGASRAYIYIYLDDEGNMVGSPEVIVNSSVTKTGVYPPADKYNQFNATQDPKSGDLNVEWNLINGFSGAIRELGGIPHYRFVSLASYILPAINGEATLSLGDNGEYVVSSLNRDPYPSLEIYYYEDGIFQYEIGLFDEQYGPFIGLNPIAPNQHEDDNLLNLAE